MGATNVQREYRLSTPYAYEFISLVDSNTIAIVLSAAFVDTGHFSHDAHISDCVIDRVEKLPVQLRHNRYRVADSSYNVFVDLVMRPFSSL